MSTAGPGNDHADQLHRQRQLRRAGGGLYIGGLYNDNGTATLTNCTVSGNSRRHSGGGLIHDFGTATLTNCTVSGNSAAVPRIQRRRRRHVQRRGHGHADQLHRQRQLRRLSGGGVDNSHYGTATLTNCTVSGNSATVSGGGLGNGPGSTTTLTNCTVSGNSAISAAAAMRFDGRTTTLTNCTVSGNSATFGGGLSTATPQARPR